MKNEQRSMGEAIVAMEQCIIVLNKSFKGLEEKKQKAQPERINLNQEYMIAVDKALNKAVGKRLDEEEEKVRKDELTKEILEYACDHYLQPYEKFRIHLEQFLKRKL